jgi:DNA ligase-1
LRAFAKLWGSLAGESNAAKRDRLLEGYFRNAAPDAAACAAIFLLGRDAARLVEAGKLLDWAAAEAELPGWLAAECQDATGDPLEAAALLIPRGKTGNEISTREMKTRLDRMAGLSIDQWREEVVRSWRQLGPAENLVFNKLLSGGLRWREAMPALARALAAVSGIDAAAMARRLASWTGETGESFAELVAAGGVFGDTGCLHSFAGRHPITDEIRAGENCPNWRFEWLWPGERAQLISRHGRAMVWSIEQEDVTAMFPELCEAAKLLPTGTVMEGIIAGWREGRPVRLDSSRLKKSPSRQAILEAPVVFLALDLLEFGGRALTSASLASRLLELDRAVATIGPGMPIRASKALAVATWEDAGRWVTQARALGAGGLLTRRLFAATDGGSAGREWIEWKAPPMLIDAVLLSVERGRGGQSSSHRKLAFGVWASDKLVPVAEIGAQLATEELLELDELVERHTQERFGSSTVVRPELVFEISFEGVQASPRRKARIALIEPRVRRKRPDKTSAQAARLDDLSAPRGAPGPVPAEARERMLPFCNFGAMVSPHGSRNLPLAPGEGSETSCGDA